jgi:hypothetical protein
MSRGGHNRRITTEQREEILRVFLTYGDTAASVIASHHGLSRDYARKLACDRGYRPIKVWAGTLRRKISA